MLSRRSDFNLTPNRFGQILATKRARGERIIDLTQSNPTRSGFLHPDARVLGALADPLGRDYDPNPRGRRDAREAVARYCAERGAGVDPERVLLTASTSEAYGWLFKLLCDDGDEILAPAPSYPLFDFLARLEGVTLRPYELGYEGRWWYDLEAIERAIGPRTRAILVVSPNNPTGTIATEHDLGAIDAIAARHDLAVVCDEVFADFAVSGSLAPVAAARPAEALTFTLSGLSKVCGLPQLKLGWIVVGGSETRVLEALPRLDLIADTYLSVSTPVQIAAATLLATRHAFFEEARDRIARNLALVSRMVGAVPSVELLRGDGGWSAVVRLPRTQSEEALVLALLEDHGVAVHPGYFFDFSEEAYVVLSLIVAESELAAGIRHILSRY